MGALRLRHIKLTVTYDAAAGAPGALSLLSCNLSLTQCWRVMLLGSSASSSTAACNSFEYLLQQPLSPSLSRFLRHTALRSKDDAEEERCARNAKCLCNCCTISLQYLRSRCENSSKITLQQLCETAAQISEQRMRNRCATA
jgi:hypothetical protein